MTFPLRRLGDYVSFANGRTSPERQDQGEFPVFGSNGLIGYAENSNAPANTSIIGRVGTYCGSVHFSSQPCWVTDNAIKAAPKNECEARFWFYAMLNRDLHSLRAGSGQPLLNQAILKQVELPVPPSVDRIEIAAILGALDDKIEMNRKTAATLEAMARALYRSWFVDFDPVHAKAEGRTPAHMSEEAAALFPDSFGEDGLPTGWRYSRLGELLTLNYGKALKKEIREAGLFPVYGSGGTDTTHKVALISEPTVIVGRKGTVGSVMWEPRGCWPIDTTYYVTSDYPMSYALRMLQHLPLAEMNTDAAVPGLNRENAYRLEVVVPNSNILGAFDALASSIQLKIDHLQSENQTLATLRDTLLPRLMSGELRVGEALEQVEEIA